MPLVDKCNFWKIPTFRQSFVIFGLISVMFSAGIGIGTATVMMPQLKKNKDDITVSETMSSWIYSLQGFGAVPIVLTIPYLTQWKGYKISFGFNCIPMITSFIMQYFASSAVHLLLAAIFQGMTMGGNLCIGIVAIAEYSDPRLRSMFLVMKSAAYFWGIWIANIIGTFFYWRHIPLIAIVPVIFAFFSCFLWPEGPYWLANKGRIDECEKSFLWLRGPGKDTEELTAMIRNQNFKQEFVKTENIFTRMKKVIVLRQFYMPMCINFVLYSSYYFTGKIVIAVYAIIVIKDITKDESSAYWGMLIIDGVTVLGMYIGSYVAMKVKRRSMMLATSAITITFLYVMSIYLCMVEYKVISQNLILYISLLVMYSFSVSWGPMVLSTSFTSEIIPMRFKPFIVSVCSVGFFMLHSISLKIAPVLFSNIGYHGTFSVYGTLTLICWIYLYKYLPETSNKTLQELETYFVNDKPEEEAVTNHNELQSDSMLSARY